MMYVDSPKLTYEVIISSHYGKQQSLSMKELLHQRNKK